ncbi:hypothetical protein [Comamonas sp. UBA7528]|uniref:hypothetical protein n=1 Tax=Comamonas sp. UBA7528 TaxID=1946391 RepID=UPI0025B7D837|nr:hypothetical protein [Comamonas sp. UBA7528]
MLSAPNFKYGLTLDEVFAGLEHGYQSVRPKLKDAERIAQWEASHQKMQEAYAFYRWAIAGFKDTLLRWKMKPEVGYGSETAIQPGIQD